VNKSPPSSIWLLCTLLRILINALVLFVLPALIIGLALFLTLFLSTTFTVIITTIVGIILIGFASYFFAYLHVFQQTVWTITYLELSKLKELDLIEEETPSFASASAKATADKEATEGRQGEAVKTVEEKKEEEGKDTSNETAKNTEESSL